MSVSYRAVCFTNCFSKYLANAKRSDYTENGHHLWLRCTLLNIKWQWRNHCPSIVHLFLDCGYTPDVWIAFQRTFGRRWVTRTGYPVSYVSVALEDKCVWIRNLHRNGVLLLYLRCHTCSHHNCTVLTTLHLCMHLLIRARLPHAQYIFAFLQYIVCCMSYLCKRT